jgi:hypothetical protein
MIGQTEIACRAGLQVLEHFRSRMTDEGMT